MSLIEKIEMYDEFGEYTGYIRRNRLTNRVRMVYPDGTEVANITYYTWFSDGLMWLRDEGDLFFKPLNGYPNLLTLNGMIVGGFNEQLGQINYSQGWGLHTVWHGGDVYQLCKRPNKLTQWLSMVVWRLRNRH